MSAIDRRKTRGVRGGWYSRQYGAQQGCVKRASFGMEDSEVASYCPQHAKDWMVSIRFTRCASEGRSTPPSFAAEASTYSSHCAEANSNVAHLISSLRVMKQGHDCAGRTGNESGGCPAVTCCPKRSMATSKERPRGEGDNELTVKRVRRSEGNVPISSRAAKSDASLCTDGETRWCHVKVETSFSTG